MAITEVYVDPSIAASSGTGTIGDPYGDVQYALDTQTRDTVNGDRFNIKAGTDEILAAPLNLTTYGTPTTAAPLVFQGYTAVADDGGIGGISGNGSHSMFASTGYDFIYLINLHLHNSGSSNIVHLDNWITVIGCEIDNGNTGIQVDVAAYIAYNYIHNCDNFGVTAQGFIVFNYIEEGAKTLVAAIAATTSTVALLNIIKLGTATSATGISFTNDGNAIIGNSIFSIAGTSKGINLGSGTENTSIINNIIEGFSGVGGVGVSIPAGAIVATYGNNAFYNNTTNSNVAGDVLNDLSASNLVLGASPFTDAPNGDFTVSTAVKALAYPIANYPNLSVRSYLDIGALQREEPAGAASVVYGLRRIPI